MTNGAFFPSELAKSFTFTEANVWNFSYPDAN